MFAPSKKVTGSQCIELELFSPKYKQCFPYTMFFSARCDLGTIDSEIESGVCSENISQIENEQFKKLFEKIRSILKMGLKRCNGKITHTYFDPAQEKCVNALEFIQKVFTHSEFVLYSTVLSEKTHVLND